ncbi:GTPase [Geodermatophilus sp. SYSU D01106]
MTQILLHQLATQAPPLLQRLRAVLAVKHGPKAEELLAHAVFEERSTPRMVLTGQFSSGKSSLVKALTDGAADVVIDSDIATDEVTEYTWDGAVTLIDTPGVQANVREHDRLAEEAITTADFVLFVMTVDLLDDASRGLLRRLALDLGKADQLLVVITHAATMSAPEGHRRQVVREAVGLTRDAFPVLEVDSAYYLRSLEDERRRHLLRRRSGIDELREAINRISENRGDLAILRQRFQLIRQLCDAGQELFAENPEQRAGLTLLALQRRTMTDRRAHIDVQFRDAEAKFKQNSRTAIADFVDACELAAQQTYDDEVARASARLVDGLNEHADRFAEDVNHLVAQQFDRLGLDMLDIAGSNRAAELLRASGTVRLRPATAPDPRSPGAPRAGSGAHPEQGAPWMHEVGEWLSNARKMWGAGDGLTGSSGSLGHGAVKDVGHFFGARFKPWQAVKIADRLGKALKVAGVALQVASTVHEVWRGDREAVAEVERQRRARALLITEIMAIADQIAADAHAQLRSIVDPPFESAMAEIDRLRDGILADSSQRDAASRELSAIAAEADAFLRRSQSILAPTSQPD